VITLFAIIVLIQMVFLGAGYLVEKQMGALQ